MSRPAHKGLKWSQVYRQSVLYIQYERVNTETSLLRAYESA
jgi:hypothetical protein